jgi:hypothetical protein
MSVSGVGRSTGSGQETLAAKEDMWQRRSEPKVHIVLPESSVTFEFWMVERSEGEAVGRAVWRGSRVGSEVAGTVDVGIVEAVVVTVMKAGEVGISVILVSVLPLFLRIC